MTNSLTHPIPDSSVASILPEANSLTTSIPPSLSAALGDRQELSASQPLHAVADLNGSHRFVDAHCSSAADPFHADQRAAGTQTSCVGMELLFCAAFLDDIERLRIVTENRLRSLTMEGVNAEPYRKQADALAKIEHEAILALQRVMRRHPLGGWVKRTKGIGEKQGARLIAAIGDVAYNHAAGRPRRGPAELWAYCGYHTLPADHTRPDSSARPVGRDLANGANQHGDEAQTTLAPSRNVAAKRRKGERANWNAEAKMRARLVAESCIKHRESPYRAVYDQAREHYAEALHQEPCPQCGPKGHPAPVGSPLSDGHKHARGLRNAAKEILQDLFLEARRT